MIRLASKGLPTYFDRKTTIVTPSPLLAAVVAKQFAEYQLSRGLETWERPAIYSSGAWLSVCWQEARYSSNEIPTLLSPAQERLAWQSIIEEQHPDLFDSSATAGMARRAARVLAEWHISAEGGDWNDHPDAQQFQAWHKRFRRKCEEENWITRSDMWRLIPTWIGAGDCQREAVVFAGFASVTPALEQIKQVLGNRAAIEPLSLRRNAERAPVKRCKDFNAEVEQAARWARTTFEEQPSRAIGIFVPGLSANEPLIRRIFEQVFYPSARLQSGGREVSIFHIASAPPLEDHPLIASALLLLELAYPRIHHADASAILRCSFIRGAAPERNARALADLSLRRFRELDVSLRQMERATEGCPTLIRIWPAVRRVLRTMSSELELAAWSEFIGCLVEAAGWPGDSGLSSREQEIVESWKDALSRLASLGLVCGPVPYGTALAELRRLLAESGLEVGDWSSPVQIVDAAEGSGVEFDSAIVIGLSDETWPPAVDVSPLVPFRLQRARKVPGSSPQSARRERERITEFLLSAAPSTVATYSGRLSPIAQRFTTDVGDELPGWEGQLPRAAYAQTPLEEIEDFQAPPLRGTGESRGGSYVLKAQSLCPFRAFAEIRLNASAIEDACFGLDARDRGGCAHTALQYVWQKLQTQARLKSTPEDELRALVHTAVSEAVKASQESPFDEQNRAAERERLEEVILGWLRLEGQRKQSFVVELTEQERSVDIAGLELHLRMDRVDRVKNGKLILIDYKTGEPKRKQLEGSRPAEPQLLVYAAALGADVEGIFFGQLKARDLRAVGFSRGKQFGDRTAEVKPDWDVFIQESREHIERIARGFVEGYAAVDPLDGACNYCAVKPFCRVRELEQREQEDEE